MLSTFILAEEVTESSGLSGGQVAAIVICLLFVFFSIISFIICGIGCVCTAQVCFLICDDLAIDSEKLKSPVSLPDIGTELQNLKLKQEHVMNGGPRNDKKKKSLKLKLHEGRGKAVLPPLSDRKGKTPRDGTKSVKGQGGDKAPITSNVNKGEAEKDLARDATKMGIGEDVILKIESDRTGSKRDTNKNEHTIIAPGGSPRKMNIIETIGLSPRKGSKIERKVSAL